MLESALGFGLTVLILGFVMAPQPLSQKRRDAKPENVHITPLAMRRYPEMAALVAEAIATWARVEAQLAKLLGDILGTAARPAYVMFSAITSTTGQFAMLRAAALDRFADRDREREVFEAIMVVVTACAKKRNPLAHHLWGGTDDLPDCLLLIDPRHDVRLEIDNMAKVRAEIDAFYATAKSKRKAKKVFSAVTPPERHSHDHIMVYTERDIAELIREFDDLADLISDFSMFAAIDIRQFDSKTNPTLHGLFDRLEAQPLIAPALRRLRERRKSDPRAPQQSPDEGK